MTARHLFKTLQWGLILFCLVFSIVGGVAAERVLDVLHCQPHTNSTLGTCTWLTNAIGLRLMPFLSAGSIVDYPFVLLRNFWALLLAWGLRLAARRSLSLGLSIHRKAATMAGSARSIPISIIVRTAQITHS